MTTIPPTPSDGAVNISDARKAPAPKDAAVAPTSKDAYSSQTILTQDAKSALAAQSDAELLNKAAVNADVVKTEDNADAPARKKQKMYTPLFPQDVTQGTHGFSSSSKVGLKLNFAQRLMELLETEDVTPVLHWMDDGKSICFEDSIKFANEIMPKYFSDTKYKSFMVRMKRWGFKSITPKGKGESFKIMKCELFRRDQPDLCLLMGDERRVDRINVAKAISKAANEKAEETKPTASSVPESMGLLRLGSSTLASELAMLQYQRNLLNMQTYGLFGMGRHLGNSPTKSSLFGDYATPAPVTSSSFPRGIGASSSLYGGFGTGGSLDDESHVISNMNILSIERDMNYCREMIAVHQDRLALLKNIREMKLAAAADAARAVDGGLSSLAADH